MNSPSNLVIIENDEQRFQYEIERFKEELILSSFNFGIPLNEARLFIENNIMDYDCALTFSFDYKNHLINCGIEKRNAELSAQKIVWLAKKSFMYDFEDIPNYKK